MFELPPKTMGILAVVILIGFMAVAGVSMQTKFQNPTFVFKEGPIYKNTVLQIQPGETYIYSYGIGNQSANATYDVFEGLNCVGVRLEESINGTGTCIDRQGLDNSRSNVTLDDPSIILYKPWMLALTDGWSWNVSAYTSFNGTLVYFGTTTYRVLRRDTYRGREAFVVEENNTINTPQYDWVDAIKRINVRITGDGYDVRLVKGLDFQD